MRSPNYDDYLPADTPKYLKEIIQRCLQKEVDQRYASMSEVLEDIQAPGQIARPAIRSKSSASRLSNWKVYAGAGAVLLALFLAWTLRNQVINPESSIAATEQRIALIPFVSQPGQKANNQQPWLPA